MQTPVHPIHLLLGAFSSAPSLIAQMKHEPNDLKHRLLMIGFLIYLLPAMMSGNITVASLTSGMIGYFFSLLMLAMPAIIINREKGISYTVSSLTLETGIAFYGYALSLVMLYALLSALSLLLNEMTGVALTQSVYLPFSVAYVVSFFALYSMQLAECHTNKIEQWHIDTVTALVFSGVLVGSIYMVGLVSN